MKLASFFTLMAIASVTPSYALEHKYSVGAGLNFNSVDTEGDIGPGTDEAVSATPALAGKVEFKINEQWAFRTGLWLQEKAAKYSIDWMGTEGNIAAHIIYASIPLTAQFQVQKDIAIFGGYIADLRINDYCEAGGDYDTCSIDEDSRSVVHQATAGISFVARENLVFDFSYQNGLTDVYKDEIKIHTFAAMAYYRF